MKRALIAPLFLASVFILAAQTAAAEAVQQIVDVTQRADGRAMRLLIESDSAPTFRSYARKKPDVLLVDIINARTEPLQLRAAEGFFRTAEMIQVDQDGQSIARLVLYPTASVTYDVTARGRVVEITLLRDMLAKAEPQTKAGPKVASLDTYRERNVRTDAVIRLAQGGTGAEGEGSAGVSTDDSTATGGEPPTPSKPVTPSAKPEALKMLYIGFNNTVDQSRVFARLNNDKASFRVKKEGENLMVLEIENAAIPLRNNKNHLDTTYFTSPVKLITPTEVAASPNTIRVIIEMKEDVPYEEKREGNEVAVYFAK